MNRRAVYPGTFDPVTYGHIDIIKRAAKIFDEVIVAVAHNPQKQPLLSFADRIQMVKDALKGLKNVTVDHFEGLSVNYVKSKKVRIILRGLRMISDFEYEFQMALTNRNLNKEIETIFMMPSEEYSFVSSKLIKEAAALGADLDRFVPKNVEKKLKSILRKKCRA
jgi:pantetheine-phosphate adenylyltransferase